MQDKIKATFKAKTSDISKRGSRRVVDVTFNPTEIQSGQDLYIKLATLPMNHVLIPGSRYLTFDFKNGNTESYHQLNLKSTLFKQITHKFNGEIYRDLNEAHVLKCYEDLWFKSKLVGKVDQGLGGSANLAKLRGKDASASGSNADDTLLDSVYGVRFKVPIDDDFLSENGAVYPQALANTHETILKVNDPARVLYYLVEVGKTYLPAST